MPTAKSYAPTTICSPFRPCFPSTVGESPTPPRLHSETAPVERESLALVCAHIHQLSPPPLSTLHRPRTLAATVAKSPLFSKAPTILSPSVQSASRAWVKFGEVSKLSLSGSLPVASLRVGSGDYAPETGASPHNPQSASSESQTTRGHSSTLGPGLRIQVPFSSLWVVCGDWSAHQVVSIAPCQPTRPRRGRRLVLPSRRRRVVARAPPTGRSGVGKYFAIFFSGAHIRFSCVVPLVSAGYNQQTNRAASVQGPRRGRRRELRVSHGFHNKLYKLFDLTNTMSRCMQGLKGSQLIWITRCSTHYDTPTFYASRVQAVCRTAHWAVRGSLVEREGGS